MREGQIASCCLEFSTLDRVIYNLVNNAIRYAADDHVDIHTSFVEPESPATLFVAVTNSISDEQEVALKRQFGDEMGRLFLGRFTTSGHGVGMSVCLECVSNAYGLLSQEETLERKLVGAGIIDRKFLAWFHWPIAGD